VNTNTYLIFLPFRNLFDLQKNPSYHTRATSPKDPKIDYHPSQPATSKSTTGTNYPTKKTLSLPASQFVLSKKIYKVEKTHTTTLSIGLHPSIIIIIIIKDVYQVPLSY